MSDFSASSQPSTYVPLSALMLLFLLGNIQKGCLQRGRGKVRSNANGGGQGEEGFDGMQTSAFIVWLPTSDFVNLGCLHSISQY